jgi:transcriptional regulator with XRE-family HTH domain
MLSTPRELLADLGSAIRSRRLAQGLTQEDASSRAGLGLRTWRRLETDGQATLETLINVAIVLRCEQNLAGLFPLPVASNLDDLLKRQTEAPAQRRRAPRKAR